MLMPRGARGGEPLQICGPAIGAVSMRAPWRAGAWGLSILRDAPQAQRVSHQQLEQAAAARR